MLKYNLSNENRSKRSKLVVGKKTVPRHTFLHGKERPKRLKNEEGLTVNQNEIQHLLQVSLSICIGYVHTKFSNP